MRKITILEHISLDGIIQGPGGRDEDTSGNFNYGGWISSFTDPMVGTALRRQMNSTFDLLLGRKTYEMWAQYWPSHGDIWPNANTAVKFVASNTVLSGIWQPSIFLNGDIVNKITKIKQEPGPDLHTWGSSDLVQTLIKHDLVDAIWLMIYPITLGKGKRLFGTGTIPAKYKMTEGIVAPNGVIVANYERAGGLGVK